MAVGCPSIFIPLPPRQRVPTAVGPDPVDSHWRVRLQLGRLPLNRVLHERLGGISLKQWFLGYLTVPVFILLVQLFVMPNSSYKTASELVQQAHVTQGIVNSEHDYLVDQESASTQSRVERREDLLSEIDSLLGGPDEDMKRIKGVDRKRKAAGVWGVMHDKSVTTQLGSFWFWGIAAFTVIQMVRSLLS
jgi:hypothetical protein